MRYILRLALTVTVGLLFGTASCSRNTEVAKKRYVESGERYLQKAKYQEARIQFRNALNLDPRFVEAYYKLAQADLALHQWNDAFAALQRSVELDAGRLDARLSIGQLYISARQYEKAEEEANAILDRDPGNPGAYQLLGTSFLGRQQNEKAHVAFAKLTQLMPKDPSGYVNLGLVEITIGRYYEAEQHLRGSIEVDPKAVLGYSNLANFYRLQRKLDKAEQVLRQGMDRIPDAVPLFSSSVFRNDPHSSATTFSIMGIGATPGGLVLAMHITTVTRATQMAATSHGAYTVTSVTASPATLSQFFAPDEKNNFNFTVLNGRTLREALDNGGQTSDNTTDREIYAAEPASIALFGSGLLLLGHVLRRRKTSGAVEPLEE